MSAEQRHIERLVQELRRVLGRLKGGLDSIEEALLFTDPKGRVEWCNGAFERLVARSLLEIAGRPLPELLPLENEAGPLPPHEYPLRLLAGASRVAGTFVYRGPRERQHLHLSCARLEPPDEDTVVVVLRDVTLETQARWRQEAQLEVTRVLAEAGTLDEAVPRLLEALCRHLGWPLGQIWLVQPEEELLACHGTCCLQPGLALPRSDLRLRRGQGLLGQVWARGRPVWISDVTRERSFLRSEAALQAGLRAAFAFPIQTARGPIGVFEFFAAEARPPDEGLLALAAGLASQIGQFVERRHAEELLRRQEEQLRRMQRLEALGRLAAGVAHDFNNLLTSVMGYCDLVRRELPPEHPLQADLQEICQTAGRSGRLVRRLMAFGQRQILQPQCVDVNALLQGLRIVLGSVLGEHIELHMDLDPEAGCTWADPDQLEQVVLDLAAHARRVMPEGGRFLVGTRRLAPEAAPGQDQVVLSFSDTAPALDREALEQIFDPFSPVGQASELAEVYGIVAQSGGQVQAHSHPGEGNTFEVRLPRCEGSPSPETGPTRPASGSAVPQPVVCVPRVPESKTETFYSSQRHPEEEPEPAPPEGRVDEEPVRRDPPTVLVAEDEDVIRKMAARVLSRQGYRVLAARHGAEALEMARHCTRLDLLLTDMIMPELNGLELSRQVAVLHPQTRILYMSGYAGESLVREALAEGGTGFLVKPFGVEELVRRVGEVLEGAGG
ncbi:MAG TPA: response regulator [Candidatus Nitrosotenuis sp.]|nr:response regulator [Candidatus Nitrosotenuis sp.]